MLVNQNGFWLVERVEILSGRALWRWVTYVPSMKNPTSADKVGQDARAIGSQMMDAMPLIFIYYVVIDGSAHTRRLGAATPIHFSDGSEIAAICGVSVLLTE